MNPLSIRKRKRLRKLKIATILRSVPETLAVDLLTLTVCSSYLRALANNLIVRRYLAKYHSHELNEIDRLLTQIARIYREYGPRKKRFAHRYFFPERE